MDPIQFELAKIFLQFAVKIGVDFVNAERAISAAVGKASIDSPLGQDRVEAWLYRLVATDDFGEALHSLKLGASRDNATLLPKFLELFDGLNAETAEQYGASILGAFLDAIEEHLFSSPGGLALNAKRNAGYHLQTTEHLGRIEEKIDAIVARPESFPQLSDGKEEHAAAEAHLHSQLDAAKELIRKQHFEAAKTVLDKLKNEIDRPERTTFLRFRLWTNLAACELHIGNRDEAARLLDRANAVEPTNPRGLSNLARLSLLREEADDALAFAARAMEQPGASEDADVVSARLLALRAASQTQAFLDLVDAYPTTSAKPPCLLARAEFHFDAGDFAEARELGERAAGYGFPGPGFEVAGRSVLEQVRSQLEQRSGLPWKLGADLRQALREAEALFSKAIEHSDGGHKDEVLFSCHFNRAQCRLFLMNFAGTVDDCRRALEIRPHDADSQFTLVNAYFQLDNHEEVLKIAAHPPPGHEQRVRDLAVYSCLQLKRHSHVVALLRADYDGLVAQGDPDALPLSLPLLSAYQALGDNDAVAAMLETLEAKFSDDPIALVVRAESLRDAGNELEAARLLTQLASPGQTPPALISLRLGDLYCNLGMFDQAVEAYGAIYSEYSPPDIRSRYCFACYRSGRWKTALQIAQELSRDKKDDLSSLQAHIHTLEEIDDLTAAIEVLAEFIERQPQHAIELKLSLDLARLHVLSEDLPSARQVLRKVPIAQLVGDSNALLLAAQLAVLCDDSRALEFAWRLEDRA